MHNLPTARHRSRQTLAEILAGFAIGAREFDPVEDAPLDDLIELPETQQIQAALAALPELQPDELAAVTRTRQSVALRLALAHRRDDLASRRPAGCWCLGNGGRGLVYVPFYFGADRDGKPIPHPLLDEDGESLTGYREYCPCPDGSGLELRIRQMQAEATASYRNANVTAAWGNVGIPSRFLDCTLDSFLARSPGNGELVEQLVDWAATDRWLVLYGLVGRGKTGIAAALARSMVDAGAGLLFRRVPDLLDRLKASYNGDGREMELLAALYAVDVLVLDDVGTDRPTDWTIERLFRIINERYDERKRTIITTNLGPNELSDFLGARNWDRLREMALFLRVAGPNLREPTHLADRTEELPL